MARKVRVLSEFALGMIRCGDISIQYRYGGQKRDLKQTLIIYYDVEFDN